MENKEVTFTEADVKDLDKVLIKISSLEEKLKELKTYAKKNEEKLMAFMKEVDLPKFQSAYFNFTLVDAYVKKIVDTDKLRAAGLYDQYSKDSTVRETLKVEMIS